VNLGSGALTVPFSGFLLLIKNLFLNIRAVYAVVMGEDPAMGVLLEYVQPGFELETYFNKHGDRFIINLGPQGINLALRDPKDVRSDLSHPHVKGFPCRCSFIAVVAGVRVAERSLRSACMHAVLFLHAWSGSIESSRHL
jgi:hypothetical protein